MHPVTPHAVKAMLADGDELALIDVREELTYSENHLLWARSVPLSRLELRFARLVPRLSTRIVLCDDADGLAQRAAAVLARAGYSNLAHLDGGVAAWAAAGYELFSGIYVPSKAFGEFIEHACETPNISAEELNRLIESRADIVVLDSRPFDEYQRVSIPTATNVPGAELVLRVRDMAPSPDTLVVVNCAGRTRSIIGAQSLINAGVPNKVVALRNGTMGFTLAGFTCERSKRNRPLRLSDESRAWAKDAAARVAKRCDVERIDKTTLDRWYADEHRTLYILDVRDPEQYHYSHMLDAISAPGGQLVQATDLYVGTLGARLVLVDDDGVQAAMTASWLKQMGWKDVFTFQPAPDTRQDYSPENEFLGPPPSPESAISCQELARLHAHNEATVIDLSLSPNYRREHITGAWFAIRSRLARALPKIPLHGEIVLTSEDGILAGLAVEEARSLTGLPVRYLKGGTKEWRLAKFPLSGKPHMADDPVDVWLKPYERAGDTTGAMNEYLSWEVDLVARIERDGTCNFSTAPDR
ncbi:MAG TPA: rhodanese-like domain-containing protein [Xanthobacteraceae bacterium]|nr:rhodanese-like domain-containing protein [Xanthobacteraceae bacterium]